MLRDDFPIRKVVLATGRTDLRLGIDGLAALVRIRYGLDPLEDGTLFLFMGRRRDRIKGILFEGSGMTLVYHRLTDGVFQWPRNMEEALALDPAAFMGLMNGLTVESSIRFPGRDVPQT